MNWGPATDHAEALAALDAKAKTECQLAAVAHCPPRRRALFAGLMGALVFSPAAHHNVSDRCAPKPDA